MSNYINEIGSIDRETLVIGTYPTTTQEITVEGEEEFIRGDVVYISPDGSITLADVTHGNAAIPCFGIICDDFTVADGETAVTTMYIKGEFNRRSLRFAEGTTADDLKHVMTTIGLIIRETRV